jgi:hypothetical protein
VIAGLKKIDAFISYPINQTVLLCNAPRPATRQYVAERFGLPDAIEWVA